MPAPIAMDADVYRLVSLTVAMMSRGKNRSENGNVWRSAERPNTMESMRRWNSPDKAMLIAHVRSGGTFLCHALDSHPSIGCERGEPLHSHAPWMVAVGCDHLKVLNVMHARAGYHVAMFKATVKQFVYVPSDYIVQNNVALVFLERTNLLRVHVSSLINSREHPAHSYEQDDNGRPVTINTQGLVETWARYETDIATTRTRVMAAARHLELTYEQITRDQQDGLLNSYVSDLLCDFLGVERRRLYTETKRRNPQPLRELIANYSDVEAALFGTPYYRFLGDE